MCGSCHSRMEGVTEKGGREREREWEKALIAFLKVRNEWELEKRAGRKAKRHIDGLRWTVVQVVSRAEVVINLWFNF